MRRLIRGGRVVTATDAFDADVLIDGESVVAVGTGLTADEEIDASGCLVMPGLVDNHTHLSMPFGGTWSCEDYNTGTASAAAGGTTCIVDFIIQYVGGSLEGRARRVARPRRRRRPHRLRLPHGDHRRPARGGRRDGGLRRRGHHELQGLHGLQGRADGRRRAVHHRARADRQDRRAGDGPLRERRRRRALPEGGDGGGQHRPEVACVVAAAGGRGRGHGPRDQARRVDQAAAVRRARHLRAGGQGDPGGARPRPADLRRDLHPVPVPDRRRPGAAGLRGRQVRVLAAAARGVQPGGPLPGAAPGRAAGHLDRPLPVQLRGAEGARARRLHEDPERAAGDRAPADAALRPLRAAGPHDGERPRPPRLVGPGADLRARQEGRDRARLRRRHRRLRSRGQAHDLGRDAPDERRLRPVRGLGRDRQAAVRALARRHRLRGRQDRLASPGHGRFVKRSVFEPALPNREPVAV